MSTSKKEITNDYLVHEYPEAWQKLMDWRPTVDKEEVVGLLTISKLQRDIKPVFDRLPAFFAEHEISIHIEKLFLGWKWIVTSYDPFETEGLCNYPSEEDATIIAYEKAFKRLQGKLESPSRR